MRVALYKLQLEKLTLLTMIKGSPFPILELHLCQEKLSMLYTFFYKKQNLWLQPGRFLIFRQIEP